MLSWFVVGGALALVTLGVTLVVCAGIWRRTDLETKTLVRQVVHLRFANKLRLAKALALDRRLPLRARIIPPGLVLYLAMPIDIIPDFIPVLGYMDDVAVLVVGVGMLLRLTPRQLLHEHLSSLPS